MVQRATTDAGINRHRGGSADYSLDIASTPRRCRGDTLALHRSTSQDYFFSSIMVWLYTGYFGPAYPSHGNHFDHPFSSFLTYFWYIFIHLSLSLPSPSPWMRCQHSVLFGVDPTSTGLCDVLPVPYRRRTHLALYHLTFHNLCIKGQYVTWAPHHGYSPC